MTETAFFVDLDTGAIRSKIVRSVAPGVRVRFNTFLKCVIGFVREEVAEALADGTPVVLVVKPALGHTEAAVALDVTATVTGTGTARRYELNALVTGEVLSGLLHGVDEAVFALQVAWGTEGAAGYGISEPLEVVVVNAYVRPGDEIPDPTGDAAWELLKDTFPQGTPDEVERTLEFALVGGATDHGALTGLGDDDHPQYFNNARGDERYAPIAAATGTNTGDVSLAGAPNYLTIVGQVITRALINLASHVTGILPRGNGGTGLSVAGAAGNVLTSDGTNWVSGAPAVSNAASARYAVHPAQWEIYWDANTTTSVSGSGVTGPVGRVLTLLTGTTLNSRAQRSGEGGGNSDVFLNGPGASQATVDFSRQVTIGFSLALISSSGATSEVYLRLGQAAGTSGTLSAAGIAIRISNLTMTGLVHNGTTLTPSGTLKTLSVGSLTTWVIIQSDGAGNVAFYVDGSLVAILTGGPTAIPAALATFAAEALNGATAAQTRIHMNQPRIRVD